MIKNIKIYDLFRHDKIVDIEFKDNFTILIGGNGCGKTTILNIINNIINKTYENLFEYSFDKIEFKISKETLIFYKREKGIEINSFNEKGERINYEFIEENYLAFDSYEQYIFSRKNIKYNSLYFPTYRRSEIDLTDLFDSNRMNSSVYTHNLNKFNNTVIGINSEDILDMVSRKWYEISQEEAKILNSFISEMFLQSLNVKTNNLEKLDDIDEGQIELTIKEMFERTLNIKENVLTTKLKTYTDYISKAKKINVNIDKLLEEKNINIDKIDKIIDGMLEQIDLKRNMDYSLARILNIIDLYENKCVNIDKLKSPITNLENTLSEFLYPKKVKIDKGNLYFEAYDSKLQFEDLSAGEKQLITLFLYISLGVNTSGVVLIDEIELSLHINWQRKIISKLIKIRPDIQFIITTHSPSILSNFKNNKVKLGGY